MTSPDKPLVEGQTPPPSQQQHHYYGSDSGGWQSSSSSNHRPPHHHHTTTIVPNPASSPIPPGFGVAGGHQHHQQQIDPANHTGPTTNSIPDHHRETPSTTGGAFQPAGGSPPPGFVSDSSSTGGQRHPHHFHSHHHVGATTTSAAKAAGSSSGFPPAHGGGGGGGGGGNLPPKSALSAEMMAQTSSGGGRSSSFVNLAAVFGTGLAESMDDATKGDSHGNHHHHVHPSHATTTTTAAGGHPPPHPHRDDVGVGGGLQEDLSLARQSRHAAARLIGASPPRVMDPLGGLNVVGAGEGLFGTSVAAAAGGGAPPPTSLVGGGIHPLNRNGTDLRHHHHHSPTATTTTPPSKTNHQTSQFVGGGGGGGYVPGTTSFPSGSACGGVSSKTMANQSSRREYSPLSMFGPNTANRRGQLPTSKDVGVTVMEPGCAAPGCGVVDGGGSPQGLLDSRSNEGYNNDDSGGVLAALMQDQQGQYCHDPGCPGGQQQQLREHQRQHIYEQQQQQQQPPSDLDRDAYYNNSGIQGGQQQQKRSPLQRQQHSYEQPANMVDHDAYEVERGMRNLWVEDAVSLGEASRQSARNRRHQQQQHLQPPGTRQYGGTDRSIASSRSGGSQNSRLIAEAEIRPFLWDTRMPQQHQYQRQEQGGGSGGGSAEQQPSRCLAILKAAHLQIPEVRSKCEAFGVLESFRSDFADRGIIFVSYYDIRSAQYAALDLEAVLKRSNNNHHSTEGPTSQEVSVYYCVPLNSSTQTDESRLVLSDVPVYVDEHSLLSLLSSYGAVRSLRRQGGYYGGSSFEAEFHNVQDSKQALMELSSTQPWGPDVAVEVSMRPPIDRKRGRELLAVIGRWRHGAKSIPSMSSTTARTYEAPATLGPSPGYYRGAESSASSSPALAAPSDTTTQLVLGPDGRYSYVIVNNRSGYPSQPPQSDYNNPQQYNRRHHQDEHMEQPRQQIVHGPNGEIYITTLAIPAHQVPSAQSSYRHGGGGRSSRDYYQPASHSHHHQYSNAPYPDSRERLDRISGPYYSHQVISSNPDHGHHPQHHHHHNPHHPHSSTASQTSAGDGDKDNKHLVLDLDNVDHGRDSRTSLMVRNIPNKYTQQMLLAEFTENGLGPGVIDFFYLPIDFKNRCNRGYAFINFVDFKDILPFHRRYFGKHWSTFNSDKICDITYARIQGKAAMLKRFENSALMEKDEEYKPLVFISHGPEKGKRIPFPEAAAASSGKP